MPTPLTLFDGLGSTHTAAVARVGKQTRAPAPAACLGSAGLQLAQQHLEAFLGLVFPVYDCNSGGLALVAEALEALRAVMPTLAMTRLHEAGELLSGEPDMARGASGASGVSVCALLTAVDHESAQRMVSEQRRQIIVFCAVARFLISGGLAQNGGVK